MEQETDAIADCGARSAGLAMAARARLLTKSHPGSALRVALEQKSAVARAVEAVLGVLCDRLGRSDVFVATPRHVQVEDRRRPIRAGEPGTGQRRELSVTPEVRSWKKVCGPGVCVLRNSADLAESVVGTTSSARGEKCPPAEVEGPQLIPVPPQHARSAERPPEIGMPGRRCAAGAESSPH